MPYLAYLALQATRPGQASYAHVHEIIKGLRARNWKVQLFQPNPETSSLPTRVLGFIQAQLKLWLRGKPDVLYVRWHFASWPTAVLARLLGIPIVQEVNGPYDDLFLAWPWTRRLSRLLKWLMRTQLEWATWVIAVTPHLAEWVSQEAGRDRATVSVVPNGANTELFNPAAQNKSVERDLGKYVIFVGTLARWQGINTMLAATEHPDWPSDVTLVIVGDGVERSKVEAFVERSSRVKYLALQPYEVIPGLIAGSVAGLAPKEGVPLSTGLFPLKVFEYLACGVPVVVTDYPGMSELVMQARCGLVIPVGSPSELARAVWYLASAFQTRKCMGDRGRRLVELEHSWERRAADTARILDKVVQGRAGPRTTI